MNALLLGLVGGLAGAVGVAAVAALIARRTLTQLRRSLAAAAVEAASSTQPQVTSQAAPARLAARTRTQLGNASPRWDQPRRPSKLH